MIPRAVHSLVLLAILGPCSPGRAQVAHSPSATPAPRPEVNHFADVEDRLHEQYPAYVGFEVYGSTLFLDVDSLKSGLRLRVLRTVQRRQAPFGTRRPGARPFPDTRRGVRPARAARPTAQLLPVSPGRVPARDGIEHHVGPATRALLHGLSARRRALCQAQARLQRPGRRA